jgi:hypothetical protein
VLLVYGGSTLFTLIRPGITPDHPWADRRMVVEVIPAMVLLAVWTAARSTRWVTAIGSRRQFSRTGPILPFLVAAALVAAFAVPMFVATAPIAANRTELGEVSAANTVCQALRPNDSVVLLDPLWVPTIRGQCGVPVAQLPNQSPAAIDKVTASIREAGRTPVIAASRSALLSAVALDPTAIVSLHTRQDQHQLLRRPDSTDPLLVEFWLVRM